MQIYHASLPAIQQQTRQLCHEPVERLSYKRQLNRSTGKLKPL